MNDFREAYIEWRLADQTYLALGRINLKSGIALGYNPTDYFKTRTVSEPLSADPTVLREDRLGTVMLRLQHIGPRRVGHLCVCASIAATTPDLLEHRAAELRPDARPHELG